MNTPPVDAEGVFFLAYGHTRRPAAAPRGEGTQARQRARERDGASPVRALRVVLRAPLSPSAPASSLLWHETGGNTTSCDPQKNSAKVLKCCPCNDRILLPEKRKLIDVRQYARIRIAVATDREN